MAGVTCLRPHADGVIVDIKLTPKAARDAMGKIVEDDEGRGWLKVSVTTVPEKGKANAHLIKFLSKKWKLPKSRLLLISGDTARYKSILILGETTALISAVSAMIDT